MKELPKQFSGKGEVSGYSFHQIAKTNAGYIYEVSHSGANIRHFEVFMRRLNERFQSVSYPKSKSFGRSAWTYPTLEMAQKKLQEITQANHNRTQ